MKAKPLTTFIGALLLVFGLSALAQANDQISSSNTNNSDDQISSSISALTELSDFEIEQADDDFSIFDHNRERRRRDRGGRGGRDRGRRGDRDRGRRGDNDRGRRGDRDRGRMARFAWTYEYVDRNGYCNRCEYSCDNAPRCNRRNEGTRMACKIRGTHDDHRVYRCERIGRRR